MPETHWVAAVAHHLAGDRDRAAELYRSLGVDRRAEQNLESLERGSLVPPAAMTAVDLFRAYTAEPWSSRLRWLAAPGRVLHAVELQDDEWSVPDRSHFSAESMRMLTQPPVVPGQEGYWPR